MRDHGDIFQIPIIQTICPLTHMVPPSLAGNRKNGEKVMKSVTKVSLDFMGQAACLSQCLWTKMIKELVTGSGGGAFRVRVRSAEQPEGWLCL